MKKGLADRSTSPFFVPAAYFATSNTISALPGAWLYMP